MLIKKIINVGIIVSLTVAGVNLYRYLQERDDGKGIVSCSLPTGNIEIIPRDGRLNAVNSETGMKLGVPERWPDGQIMITAPGGRMINATACLGQHSSWFAVKEPATQAR